MDLILWRHAEAQDHLDPLHGLPGDAADCAVKKGALWWLRHRERAGLVQTVVVTVQIPELI